MHSYTDQYLKIIARANFIGCRPPHSNLYVASVSHSLQVATMDSIGVEYPFPSSHPTRVHETCMPQHMGYQNLHAIGPWRADVVRWHLPMVMGPRHHWQPALHHDSSWSVPPKIWFGQQPILAAAGLGLALRLTLYQFGDRLFSMSATLTV